MGVQIPRCLESFSPARRTGFPPVGRRSAATRLQAGYVSPCPLVSGSRALLTLPAVYLCRAGTSFATKLAELNDRAGSDCTPVFAFFDIELDVDDFISPRHRASRTSSVEISPPSPVSLRHGFTFSSKSEESYGLALLSGVSADIQVQEAPNIIIPIAVLRSVKSGAGAGPTDASSAEPQQIAKCIDAGAVDVLTMPLNLPRVEGLLVHAYRTRKTAQKEQSRFLARRKLRKLSWVGVHDEQPYAYLREAMVSKLMKGICNPEETIEEFQDRYVACYTEEYQLTKQGTGCRLKPRRVREGAHREVGFHCPGILRR